MAAHEEIVYGLHAVEEALAAGEPVRRVIVGKQRQFDAKIKPLLEAAHSRGIAVSFESGSAFGSLHGRNHQHIIALLRPFAYAPWAQVRKQLHDAHQGLVLVLDHLEDPQNVGAVLRSAEGAGVSAVLMPEARSSGITTAVRRAAAGAASHLTISRVPNIAASVEALKAGAFWASGLSVASRATPYYEADYPAKTALVVGSEGKGLSRLVAERCDQLVHIPLRGRVAALNAAAAAAVVLFEVARRHNDGGYASDAVTGGGKPKPRPNP